MSRMIFGLSCENPQGVDDLVRRDVADGGSTYNDPQDHGSMYAHGFQDPDGPIWELMYVEPSAVQQ